MGLGDPFSTTYEGSRKSGLALGEGLQGASDVLAAFGMQKYKGSQAEQLQEKEYALKGTLAEQEAKYKRDNPSIADIFMINAMKDQEKNLPETPQDTKAQFLQNNPQYKDDEITLVPKVVNYKGVSKQVILPEVNQKKYENRLVTEERHKKVKQDAYDKLNVISKVKEGINYFGAGSAVPGILTPWDSKKLDWEAYVDNLTSGKFMEYLAKMKSESKTGATGMGALAVKEMDKLSSAATALRKTVSKETAQELLQKMENSFKVITGDLKAIETDDEYNALPSGTEFMAPDGQVRIKQ